MTDRTAEGDRSMEVDIIVEVPQGSRNKYEWDPAIDRIRLDRMLFTSTRYPHDYGFIPVQYEPWVWGVSDRVQGFTVNGTGIFDLSKVGVSGAS